MTALLVTALLAEMIPSFDPDDSAWKATHIVFVTEGAAIDGKVEVTECLAGNLRPGVKLDLSELAHLHKKRQIHSWVPPKKGERTHVSGQRVLLFLRETKAGWVGATTWGGGLQISAVWVEGKKLYAFQQIINPGGLLLTPYEGTEAALRKQIATVRRARADLAAIAKIGDLEERARRASGFLAHDSYASLIHACELIEACGPAAASALRAMLADPMWSKQHETVIRLMGRTGGEGVGAALTKRLAEDVAFWKKTGPKLKKGWWNQRDSVELRRRYGITNEALRALRALGYGPCVKTVTELRDFWRSLPQLHDKSGLVQITNACDELLQVLSR